jgi:hypothetical protein
LGGNINEILRTQNFKFHMKRIAVAIAATTVATMGSAQAAPTTFNFGLSDHGKTTILKSLDGITLKIENLTPGPDSFSDIDGLAIFGPKLGSPNDLTSLTMTFDQPVKLLSYDIGFTQLAVGVSTTYSQGALQSVQSNATGSGLKSFNNQFIAAANVPISVASAPDNLNSVVQIKSFTVEKVDPVPGPLPLAGAAAAFSWSRGLRGRIRRTARV